VQGVPKYAQSQVLLFRDMQTAAEFCRIFIRGQVVRGGDANNMQLSAMTAIPDHDASNSVTTRCNCRLNNF
jgi:hypothetical protein